MSTAMPLSFYTPLFSAGVCDLDVHSLVLLPTLLMGATAPFFSLLPLTPSSPMSTLAPMRQMAAPLPNDLTAPITPSPPPTFKSEPTATSPPSPPISSASTKRRRRAITDVASSELWLCPQPSCTQKYKKTSKKSIAQHREKCAARPLVKQWESQVQVQQELRQQLRELQHQNQELQRHNSFLIQQAATAAAAQAVLFTRFPTSAYHQHYHQYRPASTDCATDRTTCSSQPPPQPTAPTQPLPQLRPSPYYPPMAYEAAPGPGLPSPFHMWPAPHPLPLYPQSTLVSDALLSQCNDQLQQNHPARSCPDAPV
jgi:hypothetical protein